MHPHDFELLERRVNDLEKEVATLRQALEKTFSPAAASPMSKMDVAVPPPEKTLPKSQYATVKEKPDLETLIGQIWLPRVFIIVLLVGCIFGFKVASDNHLLSPALRILAGYAGAVLLFLLGFWQVRKDRSRLGMILFGGTVVLLMLTTFACHVLYHFIPPSAAFAINAGAVLLGLGLSYVYKSEYLAIFVGIGGYLLPFLLDNTSPNILVFAVYESLLYLVLFLFAVVRRYRILYIASIFLLNLTFLAAFIFNSSAAGFEPQLHYFAAGVLIQHMALLLHCLYRNKKLVSAPVVLYISFTLLAGWWAAAYSEPSFIAFMSIAILLYGGLAWKGPYRSLFASIATYACFFLIVRTAGHGFLGILVLIEGTIGFFIGHYYRQKLQRYAGLIVYMLGAVMSDSWRITAFFSIDTVYWCVLVLTLGMIYYLSRHFLAAILFTAALFALVTQWSLVLSRFETGTTQQMILSIVWAAFALLFVLYGKLFNSRAIRISGVALLFLVLIKVVLIDLPIVSLWVRAVLFIIIGIAGLIASRFFYTFKRE